MIPARRARRPALLLLAALLITGCRSAPPPPPAPPPLGPVPAFDDIELVARLRAHYESLRTFEGFASIHSDGLGKLTDYKGILLYRNPDRFRLRSIHPLPTIVLFDFRKQGRSWTLEIPGEEKVHVGVDPEGDVPETAEAGSIDPIWLGRMFTWTSVPEAAWVPTVERDPSGRPLTIVFRSGDRVVRRTGVGFDGEAVRPILEELVDSKGKPQLRVHLGDYRVTNGVGFPWSVLIEGPESKPFRITCVFGRLKINQPLAPEAFDAPPATGGVPGETDPNGSPSTAH